MLQLQLPVQLTPYVLQGHSESVIVLYSAYFRMSFRMKCVLWRKAQNQTHNRRNSYRISNFAISLWI